MSSLYAHWDKYKVNMQLNWTNRWKIKNLEIECTTTINSIDYVYIPNCYLPKHYYKTFPKLTDDNHLMT